MRLPIDPASVPLADIPATIGALEAAKAALLARLAQPVVVPPATPETWLRAEAAARLIGWSTSLLRKRGHLLPGYRRISPGRVRWSQQQLEAWVAGISQPITAGEHQLAGPPGRNRMPHRDSSEGVR